MKTTKISWLLSGIVALGLGAAWVASSSNRPAHSEPLTQPKNLPKTPLAVPEGKDVAVFAAGCFWSMEAIFEPFKGVEKVDPGYAGGQVVSPSYEQVCTDTTGHAETIAITYDPKVISYSDLVEVMLTMRNPTTLNSQGPDTGEQYRSVIFYRNAAQKEAAEKEIAKVNAEKIWSNPIVTKVTPFSNFYIAEKYHRDYYRLNPNVGYSQGVIAPEIAELHKKYGAKLR